MFLDKVDARDQDGITIDDGTAFGLHSKVAVDASPQGRQWQPHVGDIFPNFVAPSTLGPIRFHEWAQGSWVHLFSDPESFSPVGSSELVEIARCAESFHEMGVKHIAISSSPVEDQQVWAQALENRFDVEIDFPQVADVSGDLLRLIGSGRPGERGSQVRKAYLIDPSLRVRMVFEYPVLIGRSIAETLRVIDALQTMQDVRDICLPADWQEGDAMLLRNGVPTGRARLNFGDAVTEILPFYRKVEL